MSKIGFWALTLLFSCRLLSQCNPLDYVDHTLSVIGPDVYNASRDYKNAYANELEGTDSKAFNVSKFVEVREKLGDLERNILLVYKEAEFLMINTSRFYYNYRHAGNIGSVTSALRRFGLASGRQMVSFIPESCLCHPTNVAPGRLYNTSSVGLADYSKPIKEDRLNIFHEYQNIEYKGDCIKNAHLRHIMTERYPAKYPRSARLTPRYRVEQDGVDPGFDLPSRFIFITGHGGDSYLQMQAKYTVASMEIKLYFDEMYIKHPHQRVLAILDTCEADTMFIPITKKMPLVWIASSKKGAKSYSYNSNTSLGVPTVDRFSYHLGNFLNINMGDFKPGKKPQAAVSRLTLSRLLRYQERLNPTDIVAHRVNDTLVQNGTRAEKLYLGEYFINYMIAYFNQNRMPLKPLAAELQREKFEIGNKFSTVIQDIPTVDRLVRLGLHQDHYDLNVHTYYASIVTLALLGLSFKLLLNFV